MYNMTTTLATMSGCLSASQCTCCALVPNACPPAPTSIARFLTRSLSSLCLSRSLALARALSGSLADQEGSVWPRRTWPCHCPLSTVTSSHMSHHHTHVTSSLVTVLCQQVQKVVEEIRGPEREHLSALCIIGSRLANAA